MASFQVSSFSKLNIVVADLAPQPSTFNPQLRSGCDSRTPDIGELKMSAFSSQRLADGVAHSQSRSWEKGWGRVQFLAEFGDHSRAMNRALCGQRDAQFLMGHLDVCPAG